MNKTLTAIKKSAPVNSIRKLFQDYSSIFAILLMGAIFTIASPYFLTKTNINNILLQSSALAIAAIGQAMIVISGNLDLSLGQCVFQQCGFRVFDEVHGCKPPGGHHCCAAGRLSGWIGERNPGCLCRTSRIHRNTWYADGVV